MSDAPFGPAAGFRCLKICRTISFSGSRQRRTFRRFPCFAGRRRRRSPAGVYLFVRHGIRVAVHPAWPSFRRSRHGRRLSVDCRRRRSCLCSCARSDPPTGHLRAGGAGTRDNGADRSESPERRDAGRPRARLAAAHSASPARLSRRAMDAGGEARGHTRSDYLMGLIAARGAEFLPRHSPAP